MSARSWGRTRASTVDNRWTTTGHQHHRVKFHACRVKTVDNQWIHGFRWDTAESRFSTIHRAYYYNHLQSSQEQRGSGDNPVRTTVGRTFTDPENPDAIPM